MSNIKVVELKQGSPEWHTWRRKGVGASETPILLEKSPYSTTKRDLFFDKSGLDVEMEEQDNFIFRVGHEQEEIIRAAMERETGIKFEPVCLERNGVHLASLDGYDPGKTVLEAKYVGKKVLALAKKTQEIPEHHLIQINKQMFVADVKEAYWCGTDGKEIVAVKIHINESLVNDIVMADIDFMSMVKSGTPPPITEKDTVFITDEDAVSMAKELAMLKGNIDSLQAHYKDLESRLKEVSEHPKVNIGGLKILTIERSGSVDYAKVPELKGLTKDYLDKFRKKSTTYKKLTFPKQEVENDG